MVAARSHRALYDRDAEFGDWIDQGEGCDTRAVVLREESQVATTQNAGCTIETGRWYSYYNATSYADPEQLQIDHVVPVENVWVAGAWRWTQATRVGYYNDLADARTLVAVDVHDNESKGDQTPDSWLPPAHHCRYLRDFVVVKLRWQLTVTSNEVAALSKDVATCPNVRLRYTPAVIRYESRGDRSWQSLVPLATRRRGASS